MHADQDANERFAGNNAINAAIHAMLARTTEPSRSRMRKKIREHRDALRRFATAEADAAARHVFREFVVGVELNDRGLSLEYGARIGGQTPDWYDAAQKLLVEVFTCERGGRSNPILRIASSIETKVQTYASIVADKDLFLVVAVYGDFETGLDAEDCRNSIEEYRLFPRFPDLSGVIFYSESHLQTIRDTNGSLRRQQIYSFSYFPNPVAKRPMHLAPYFVVGSV